MKKIFLSFIMFAMVTAAYAQKVIVNDPNAEQRSLNGSFDAIKISGGIDLYLSQYETESIAVSAAEQKYTAGIKTVIENNTLMIYYDGNRSWNGNKKLKAYISFKNLQKLQASGGCDVQVAGTINVPSLHINMSGGSDFKGDVKLGSLIVSLSGASDLSISGSAASVNIESTGASDVKGFSLVTETCTAKASGASDINITVNKELTADASGASDIYYKGTGVIKDQRISGASSVGKKS